MAIESALQKLLRQKKEKEQQEKQNESTRSPNSDSAIPVQDSQERSPDGEERSVEVEGEILSKEDTSGAVDSPKQLPSGSDSVVAAVESVQVKEEVTPAKPLSAMERLRQLRAGGSTNVSPTQETKPGNESGSSPSSETSSASTVEHKRRDVVSLLSDAAPPVVQEEEKPKTQKTHPIAMEMAELEEALEKQVPGFISILSTIHKKLKADPNVVTLLDEDEIRTIVSGLEKHANVTIVAPAAAKAASKRKKEPVSADDL